MSDQDELFKDGESSNTENQDQGDQGDTGNTENNQEPSRDELFDTMLADITREDGTQKYSDVAKALESIPESQAHIDKVEKEAAELREKLAKAQAAEELLRKAAPNETAQSLDESQILEVVAKAMDLKTEAETKKANLDTVWETFSSAYGEKAKAQMKQIAKDNGVGLAFLQGLGETAPKALFKLAGIDQKTITPGKNTGQSTDNFVPKAPQETPKSVMSGANTNDMVNAWRAAKPQDS